MIDSWQVRQRIAAKDRRLTWIHLQPQDNKLTRPSNGKRLLIDWRQNEGGHAIAFLTDMRDEHLSEAGPRWFLFLICEPGVSHNGLCTRPLIENRPERTLPALAKGGNSERPFHALARVSW